MRWCWLGNCPPSTPSFPASFITAVGSAVKNTLARFASLQDKISLKSRPSFLSPSYIWHKLLYYSPTPPSLSSSDFFIHIVAFSSIQFQHTYLWRILSQLNQQWKMIDLSSRQTGKSVIFEYLVENNKWKFCSAALTSDLCPGILFFKTTKEQSRLVYLSSPMQLAMGVHKY